MFPATRAIQKELLPLVDRDGLCKPTIQVIVEECLGAGIEEVCIVVERGGQGPFREHFRAFTDDEKHVFEKKPDLYAAGERLGEISERISYVEQPSPEGFGHAVYQAKDWVGDEPFVLLLGDHVYTTRTGVPSPVAQLIAVADETGGSVTGVLLDPESEVTATGVLKCEPRKPDLAADAPGQSYNILRLKEKPTPDEARATLRTDGVKDGFYLCHFGIHLFTTDIFGCLGHLIQNDIRVKNEFQLTSGQELLLERSLSGAGTPYGAVFLDAQRWDTGKPDVYLEALTAYGSRGPFASRIQSAPVDNTP
jgi:UTP--glucose-1-phosphate uridylyltransferase